MSNLPDTVKRLRILTVGAPGVGKTTANMACMTGKFPSDAPKEYNDHSDAINAQHICMNYHTLGLNVTDLPSVIDDAVADTDNAGKRQVEYGMMHPHHVVICMYDISRPDTLVALEQKIIPEFKKSRPAGHPPISFVIVGCKADLRASDDDNSCVPLEGFETGKALFLKEEKEGCIGWCEISAKEAVLKKNPVVGGQRTPQGLMVVLKIIVDHWDKMGYFKPEKKGCCIVQ
jgi:GTPase SAR1 family protein